MGVIGVITQASLFILLFPTNREKKLLEAVDVASQTPRSILQENKNVADHDRSQSLTSQSLVCA